MKRMIRNRRSQSRGSESPAVTFWGAAGSVTGSMHLVEAGGQRLLLDCGLVQGSRSTTLERNRRFPFRPKTIDAVLLSHAHIDHCGNLPNLVKQGFRGPIYSSPATRALAAVMLGDSAKIQEEDAGYLNRHRPTDAPPVEPLYTGRDVYRTLLQLKAVPYDAPFAVGPRLEARLTNAGHLLGSAMVSLSIAMPEAPGVQGRLSYTGDLGRPGLPILREPAAVPAADLLICECTYGGQRHEPVEETAQRLGEVVCRTAHRGGRLLIPAFSVGRTQTVVYFLHQLLRAGQLPDLPIYVDSPLAVRATEVFQSHADCFNDATRKLLEVHPELFAGRRIRHIERVDESIALNRDRGPCVIISSSGMCEAGRVLHHLKYTVEDARSTILLAGYQADGTLGRRIAERQAQLRILGQSFSLKAEVVVLNGLSHHADHEELLASLRPLASQVARVRLVHGEPEPAQALAAALRAAGFADVAPAEPGEQVPIAPD